jgi:hypothetical protein
LISTVSLGRGWAAASTRCSQLATGAASGCAGAEGWAGAAAGGASEGSSRIKSIVCIVRCILYQKRQDPLLCVIPVLLFCSGSMVHEKDYKLQQSLSSAHKKPVRASIASAA